MAVKLNNDELDALIAACDMANLNAPPQGTLDNPAHPDYRDMRSEWVALQEKLGTRLQARLERGKKS